MLSMQDALLALTKYWAGHGCLTVQPMNTEVGAGTLNPATFLRVLGPEPWKVAYVEPSVRPDDARYGQNPNRIQTHTQFQVILKPEPGNAQELYLGSLAAIGVDVAAHDVRFVEDNWASPALGAWGLGWEVWLDGLEITQFTYFQQAGGLNLDPVSVEITYGMERILMALQGVSHFKDIVYADGVSYGEVFGQAEYEMSRYYLDDADVAANQTLFDTYAAEARRMIDAGLPIPANTYVLKCSHAFNVLDARGAISPTERARAFGQMRRLAGEVAKLWTLRREEAGHPLGLAAQAAARPVTGELPVVDGPSTVVFEIGMEELPPAEVTRTAEALRAALTSALAGTRLGHGDITVYGAPRRVAAVIAGVAPREDDHDRQVRGPRLSAAYDAEGKPTKAVLGFARGKGVDVADLQQVDVDGVSHVAVVQHVIGRTAATVLAEVLPGVVTGLQAEKNMRWNAPGLSFSRPIRWIVALLGAHVVPFTVANLTAGRTTAVHRTAAQPHVDVPAADAYLDTLTAHGVVADAALRRSGIIEAAGALAAQVGGVVDVTGEAKLIDEVTNLVEAPTAILGGFDPSYLDLPADILTTVMRKHQRYLPVRDADGGLLPHFVAVANGQCDIDQVRAGNEAVLRARYEDAAFFWRADLTVPVEQLRAAIGRLTFAERLGSMADRADRIAALAAVLADRVGLSGDDLATLRRAGALVKFDLSSQMVTELSSLAGVMAREYALRAGEPAPVATAVFEAELPRQAGDITPATPAGALLALADRFDLLAGLFAVGATPTGSSDPFGMRRAALGVVSILRGQPALAAVTVPDALAAAAQRQPVPAGDVVTAATEFIVRRYEQQLLDAGHEHRLIQAVLPLAVTPAHADATLEELERRVTDPAFGALVQAVQRVVRIVPAGTPAAYAPDELREPAELALHDAVAKTRVELGDTADLGRFADLAAALVEPVNTFFDDVLVMDPDPAVRANRLGLLAAIRGLGAHHLDWAQLD
ncbi:glycine--tRNA ligase [Dactylosporangium sp. NPDC049525]|uniref:glycine--tRNA ligase n=1 Tax=Dactylosporangium sp. NPDC049525 TaxID=3154730 RepID=UPI003434A83F